MCQLKYFSQLSIKVLLTNIFVKLIYRTYGRQYWDVQNVKGSFQVVFGKKYLLVLTEKHGKKGAMKITETVQSELDLVKQKQKEKNWSQKLELYIVFF